MAPPRACAPCPCPAQVLSLSIEKVRAANAAGSDELDSLLDAAFDASGLGLLCLTGGEEFQDEVRRIRRELLPLAPALSNLPEDSLADIAERPGSRNVNGYSRGVDGHRSGFYFHPASDDPGASLPAGVEPEATFYAPNRWPDGPLPELRQRARAAAPFLVEVGRELAVALDRRLSSPTSPPSSASSAAAPAQIEPGALAALVGEVNSCNHKCRLICYHEYEREEQRTEAKGMWAAPHKDTGLFTILVPGVFFDSEGERLDACPDPEVGLYVRDRQGAICRIAAPSDAGECLFFQLGEAMQIVSGGFYHATEHCVRGPPRCLAGYTRASLAVFFQPHAHEDLPLPPGTAFQDVASRAHDGMFRMFLLYQPEGARGINFLRFCLREGF
mmetsp:Transcript_971/g.3905  ORF Transcript_971/g.3905 Transcript_971/m.3905 type:complete len:387 (-) Transcript_971:86-1246(-)